MDTGRDTFASLEGKRQTVNFRHPTLNFKHPAKNRAAASGGREHSRYVAFQMAEVAVPRNLFDNILRLIAKLQPPPAVAST
jgi:hypothetical protein